MSQHMTPAQIVSELDKFIIGQQKAKRAVAIALRSRWRRQQIAEPLKNEITPKNILMIGPTGVGKTEIARRLAKLADAPFIKVEATKFTEVGYVGRDVETIIRDLAEIAVKQTRETQMARVQTLAADAAEERILDVLVPPARDMGFSSEAKAENTTRQTFRKRLREGQLDEQEIEIEISALPTSLEIMGPAGMEDMTKQLQEMFGNLAKTQKKPHKIKVKDAVKQITEEEAARRINEEEVRSIALKNVEQNGIVFLDEIDKIVSRQEYGGADISRQGVQRDLLPLVEGTTVSTKFGTVKTDHILFIASGAFHMAKPSDLVPELQGRFPIRVELESLTAKDFQQILTQTDSALTKQYQALLGTENVQIVFTDDGIVRLAEIAFSVNERVENIGARRLYTVMEKLLEDLGFEATQYQGQTIYIDAAYVDARLTELSQNEDIRRYVL